jgi:hypothetical protein
MSCSSTASNQRMRIGLAFLGGLHSCLLAKTGGYLSFINGSSQGWGCIYELASDQVGANRRPVYHSSLYYSCIVLHVS